MNEKLELLNALQAELEGMGIRISAVGVNVSRTFQRDQMDEREVLTVTMPCESGFYHAEWVELGRGAYEVSLVREIQAQVRNIDSTMREHIMAEKVKEVDGPTLKRLFVAAVTKFSAPYMQDFAMVCANWPVPTGSAAAK